MKIEANKYYKTRDGRKVRVYATEREGNSTYPVIGDVLNVPPCPCAASWTADGRVDIAAKEHPADIIAEWIDAPVVDWPAMPKWAKWVGRDRSGNWLWFELQPKILTGVAVIWSTIGDYGKIHHPYIPTFYGDWKDSLVERPKP